MNLGDYIIYVDESGDHGLQNIDPDYPVFVLSFCCFRIEHYINQAVPQMQRFKFSYFGHDQVILHEHHIRKQKDEFSFLRLNQQLRTAFLIDINKLVENIPFEIFSIIVDKRNLKTKYISPINPYHLGLQFGLEIIYKHLLYYRQHHKKIHFIFEKRGKKEDARLSDEIRKISDNQDRIGWKKVNIDKIKFKMILDRKSVV